MRTSLKAGSDLAAFVIDERNGHGQTRLAIGQRIMVLDLQWSLLRTMSASRATFALVKTLLDSHSRHDACFIGIIGWLLFWRSACREGLDASFSHFPSWHLMLNLPRLISPLRQITPLELCLGHRSEFLDLDVFEKELWWPPIEGHEKPLGRLIRNHAPMFERSVFLCKFWMPCYIDEHPVLDRVPYFQRKVSGRIEIMTQALTSLIDFKVSLSLGMRYLLLWEKFRLEDGSLVVIRRGAWK